MSRNENEKWIRRNLIALFDGQPYCTPEEREANYAECDRIFIALHRFQTDGKIAYRRLVGMHGGGGGTSDEEFRKILTKKMQKDIDDHYGGNFPDNGYWPEPVPNAPFPKQVKACDPDRCFAYTFCWHAEPEFLIWHRPFVCEFERGLQEHDPKFKPGDERRHEGSDALGLPYWGWEDWDGTTLPQVVSNHIYVLKTDCWKEQGYPKGSIFHNPFNRWFAPVSIEDQKKELFHSTMAENNTTTRSAAFDDNGADFSNPWEQISFPTKPAMKEVVKVSLQNPNWLEFCTMKSGVGGSTWSIENAHNKFHNRVGGLTKGGIQGSGTQIAPDDITPNNDAPNEFTGTMAQNQSSFDPIFWIHHSNVERQLMTWQRFFANKETSNPESKPSKELMNRVLYPWTKPNKLFNGELSWNTPSCQNSDATFASWWDHTNLPYKYDEYVESAPAQPHYGIIPTPPSKFTSAIRMTVFFSKNCYRGGEYELFYTSKSDGVKKLVGAVSVISAQGSVCGRCAKRAEGSVAFEVSETFDTIEDADKAFKENELCLTRNNIMIKIGRVEISPWCS